MEIKPIAIGVVKSAVGVFTKDLEALPEDAFSKDFGGKSRTVADIVTEVNMVNDHIGMVIRGETPFEWPDGGWIKAPEGFACKETIVTAFKESTDKFLATLEGFSEEQFMESILDDGSPTNRFERCRFAALHLWYHSGQLNFMQTLLGDDAWHW
ncbi:MAG: hypothetical protein JST40_11250 [Armatimonadetes bacterium]|nr:hypothetical protein [Armatimonadota bacterium]